MEKLNTPVPEFKPGDFNNKLKPYQCSHDDWASIKKAIIALKSITINFWIYVFSLAYVFENFIHTSINTYRLDPCYYALALLYA